MSDAVRITLRFGSNGGNPQHHTLRPEDCLRIGRDPASEVPVNLPGVSWAHAELRLGANGALCLRDLSSNGTGFKDASGGIARVKRGLDVEVPEKSLVVLPLKVKAATNAIESRMCFAVELNSEEPPPDPLEEARKLQPQLVREVQAALQEQLAQAPAPAPGQPEPSAEPPAEPPAEPQLERAAPEETPEAPEPKPAKEAEDEREAKDEKEKKERREKAKEGKVKESKETGRGGRSRQGSRSSRGSRSRGRGRRSGQRTRERSRRDRGRDGRDGRDRRNAGRDRREDRREDRRDDRRGRDGRRSDRSRDRRDRRRRSSRSRSRSSRSRSRSPPREKRPLKTTTNFSSTPSAPSGPSLPQDLIQDLKADESSPMLAQGPPGIAGAGVAGAPIAPLATPAAACPVSPVALGTPGALPGALRGPVPVRPGLPKFGVFNPAPSSGSVQPKAPPGPLNLAEAAAKAAAALMAKEAPASPSASLGGPLGPGPLGPGPVAPRPFELKVSFEVGSDVQVLSQGQWKIGTVLAETASGFLVLTDSEQLEVPAASVRRPSMPSVKSAAFQPGSVAARGPPSPFTSIGPRPSVIRPPLEAIRPNLPLRLAAPRPRPF